MQGIAEQMDRKLWKKDLARDRQQKCCAYVKAVKAQNPVAKQLKNIHEVS
jgi:hypothetical protein